MRAIVIACTLLLLAACDGADTYVVRSRVDGHWQIDARARVESGFARFECRRSASGACHFTLFESGAPGAMRLTCDASGPGTACEARLLKQFALPVSTRTSWPGLSGFRLCASHDPAPLRPDCMPREASRPGDAAAGS